MYYKTDQCLIRHKDYSRRVPKVAGASFEGGWGGRRPPRKKKKRKKKEKRKKREKERKKEGKRKKGTINYVKLLHIKCCFFQFFNCPMALKNKKKFWPPPQEKVEMTPLKSGIKINVLSWCVKLKSSAVVHGVAIILQS